MSRKSKENDSPEETEGLEDSGMVEESSGRHDRGSAKAGHGKKALRKMEIELEEAKSEAETRFERLLRLQAEFENFKKRQIREKDELRKHANEKLLKCFLPVVDNLERAVKHSGEEVDPAILREGMELVLKQFREGMVKFGVEPIAAQGEEFDPHLHEAMSRVDTDGDPPDGTVVEEYQKGYLLHGKVLRPSMVGVAKEVDSSGEIDNE